MERLLNLKRWFGILPHKKDVPAPQISVPQDRNASSIPKKESRRSRQDSNWLAFYKAIDLSG